MATTTLENHISSNNPEIGNSAEQLLDEQLQAAGLINISSKVKEWIASNPIALDEVGRLADKGFGSEIQNNTAAQGLLNNAFAEAMALQKLRQDGPARDLPLDVYEVIQSTEPEGARELVVDGVVIPNDLSSLDATPQATIPEPSLPVASRPQIQTAISSPSESVAAALGRESGARTPVQETATSNESRGWFKRVRNLGKRGVAATLIAGAAATGVGAGIAKFVSLEGQPQSVAAALELAANEKTLEEKKNFFDGAVDVHTLPGRMGNNFGPAVSYDDLRIDTPEAREKTLHGFSEMLRGNTDIMVAYMYTFNLAGDKITPANASQRLQQLKDLATSLKDEKNIDARYEAHQEVMAVLSTMQGGAHGAFGPEHISWYIGPDNHLGLDNSVLDNGAEYVTYEVTLLDGTKSEVKILKNCGRQVGTEELQQLVQYLIPKETPVATSIVAPAPVTQIPHGWNSYPGGGGGSGGGGGGGGTPPPNPEHPPETQQEVKDYSGGVSTAPGIDPNTVVFRGWTPNPEVAGNGTSSPNLNPVNQAGSEAGGRADGASDNTERQVERAEDGAGESRTEADREAKKQAEKEAKKQADADKKAADKKAAMESKKAQDDAVRRAQSGMDSSGRPSGSSGSSSGASGGNGGSGNGNSSGGSSDGGNS